MENPPPTRIPIEQACEFLKYNPKEITSVKEWAEAMGRTRAHFTRRFKVIYGVTPAKKMAAIRWQDLQVLIQGNPEYPSELLATKLGFKNAKSLCRYICRHYDTSLTQMRKEARKRKWMQKW